MSVEDQGIIDIMSFEPKTNKVILTISNHLDWKDELNHLYLLQEKVNSYISFYESGQLYRLEPSYKGKEIVIRVSNKYPPTQLVNTFYMAATRTLESIGISLEVEYSH